jgi:dienelactone hydrolase
MKSYSFLIPIAVRLRGVTGTLGVLAAAAAFLVPSLGAAQLAAPGEAVTIPGAEVPGLGQTGEFPGRFGRHASSKGRVPAVLILHGAAGVDGRGAFYAKALQDAGIATLEITMFTSGNTPDAPRLNLPHAAAALKWLAGQPNVDSQRLGVMGFSWGGMITLLTASELVQEKLGKGVPRPVAFAPFYPLCTPLSRNWLIPQNPLYNAHTRMSATPMLIQVGTRDVNEDSERACSTFVATWPSAARELATVRYIEGATHGFDMVGGMNPDAVEARQVLVAFFVKHLKP